MKKTLVSLLIIAALALSVLPAPVAAQVTTSTAAAVTLPTGPLFTILATVDSVNTYYSNPFSLSGIDAESFYSYPISYGKLLAHAGTPKVTVTVEGSFGFSTWATIDTVLQADSLKTFAYGTLDLNDKHYPKYRLKIVGATGNRSGVTLNLVLYARQKH